MANCNACAAADNCYDCASGYFMNSTSMCEPCMAGCAVCTDTTTCVTCSNYYNMESGFCVAMEVPAPYKSINGLWAHEGGEYRLDIYLYKDSQHETIMNRVFIESIEFMRCNVIHTDPWAECEYGVHFYDLESFNDGVVDNHHEHPYELFDPENQTEPIII